MIKRLTLIVSILFTVITTAQEGTSSPYSFYGLGLTTFSGTVENQSMGGISVFSDSIHMNLRNPAAYGKLALTTYTLGGTHSEINMKGSNASTTSSVTSLDYLAVGLPAGKFGFGFGLIPYTSVGYDLITMDEAAGTAGTFSGTGGINKVFLSAGYEINKNLSVGVDVNYKFGTIENKSIHLWEGVQYASREVNYSSLGGFDYRLGLSYQGMLSDKLQLMASAMYSPEMDLTSRNERELATVAIVGGQGEAVFDIRDLSMGDTEMTMPAEYTLGAGLGQPRKWFMGMEYTNVEANHFTNRSFSTGRASFTSASHYRIGGFYIPDYSSLTSYFSRIVYRGGFRMMESGLHLDGEAINEFGISFGVGLPAGRRFSNINLGFEYGQRGTVNADLIQEDFFKVSISLSLNDKWFVKRKFD